MAAQDVVALVLITVQDVAVLATLSALVVHPLVIVAVKVLVLVVQPHAPRTVAIPVLTIVQVIVAQLAG